MRKKRHRQTKNIEHENVDKKLIKIGIWNRYAYDIINTTNEKYIKGRENWNNKESDRIVNFCYVSCDAFPYCTKENFETLLLMCT